jgi:hypothetical protein
LPFHPTELGEEFNIKISLRITFAIGFKGKYLILLKTNLLNSTVQEIPHFNYLGNDISYEEDNKG